MQINDSRALVQNCWVVPDLESAMDHWLRLGYGPFLTMHVDLPDALYRGRKVPLCMSGALVQAGPVIVELIQQHSEGPSAYRDVYAPGEGGFHHVCRICDDYEKEKSALEKQGFVAATEGSMMGLDFCYVDMRSALGCMVELVPNVPMIRDLFGAVAGAARNWDGKNPIRPAF